MKYLSVCSGIEAASAAWHSLKWEAVGFSEIDRFPCAVLSHHFPDVPNLGNITDFERWNFGTAQLDILVGGTPCQSFSVAGLRKGLEDPRGNLMLTYLAIAKLYRPRWIIWENVPGVLSSNGGRDFGTFLGALGLLGYQYAYRILDAQFFGVAQRRRRVFVVGYLGDENRAAKVLFDGESLRGNPAPSRKTREGTAPEIAGGVGSLDTECDGNRLTNQTIRAGQIIPCFWNGEQIAQTLDAVLAKRQTMPEKNRFPAVLVEKPQGVDLFNTTLTGDLHVPLRTAGGHGAPAVLQETIGALCARDYKGVGNQYVNEGKVIVQNEPPAVSQAMQVRRLTPTECERLQGFPDNWTRIPYRGKPAEDCPDGPRYKALGNSMAVPVMKWIGERIAKFDSSAKGAE